MRRENLSDPYALTSALFLRLLALVYLAAFVSTATQIVGLIGDQGILPVADLVEAARSGEGRGAGFWSHPMLFWLDTSNDALFAVTLAGCFFSFALFLNILPRLSLILLFVLYLSVFHAGQLFMNFQWDYLLLESGFIAIFLASGARRPAVWLLRWLLFRFRFLSGVSKLISQDPTWANLTALSYFFEVQPLPHWGGWYAQQLPEWVLRFSTGAVLFIEILVPFTLFMSRRLRLAGAGLTILLQLLILLTSNHNYANILVLVLCLFFFEDRDIQRVVPRFVNRWLLAEPVAEAARRSFTNRFAVGVAVVITVASLFQMWHMISGRPNPAPVAAALRYLQPFHVVNRYHVFPTMKTERIELVIDGSMDGEHWKTYEFRYKPGDPMRRPEVIVPHHPRLDWLMWFVPTHPLFLPWFEQFLGRLAENSPAVLDLMQNNPFPDQPPRYLAVSVFRYRFSSPEIRAAAGQWWVREYLGPFEPFPGIRNPPPEAPVGAVP